MSMFVGEASSRGTRVMVTARCSLVGLVGPSDELDLWLVRLILVLRTLVLLNVEEDDTEEDAPDEEVPEQVDALEEEDGREDLPLHPRDHPFAVERVEHLAVLLWNQVPLGVNRPQNPEVEVVAEVGPNANEEREERGRRWFTDVVDTLGELHCQQCPALDSITHSEENVRNIHGDEDGDTNVRQLPG